ncbi:MAG: 2-C-methyl-D-erythritol 4-phosphate cytidylyltransferase [Clostridia bacterium]|nr:2-C-methyl-D-erythritol 4-phosphate cytidylyltransferase [Clostridia bacterium]MBQ8398969.1 2-C-methyl-D-erythritol 4-phosphate cytidylyltransferase [Clostridia bacterium]
MAHLWAKKQFSAMILAGGSSTRMGGISKQQYRLLGVPVAVHTLRAFERCKQCAEIIIVSKADECTLYEQYAKEYGLTKIKCVLPGGSTRQESAFLGLKGVSADSDFIAIHDAARCLITPEQITNVFLTAMRTDCATAACPATDTVKFVSSKGKTETDGQPERSKLWNMQTPQIFYTDLYRAAAYTAREDGFAATDDCSLLEHVGFGCTVVDCGRENIKITTPVDLLLAEAILKEREKGAEQ